MRRPVIVGGNPYIMDYHRKNAQELFDETGGNSGNLAFMFGVANQLLACTALCVGTTIVLREDGNNDGDLSDPEDQVGATGLELDAAELRAQALRNGLIAGPGSQQRRDRIARDEPEALATDRQPRRIG